MHKLTSLIQEKFLSEISTRVETGTVQCLDTLTGVFFMEYT